MGTKLEKLQKILDEMEINVGLIPPYEIDDKEFKNIESFVKDFIKFHEGTIMEEELYKLYNGNLLTESNNKTYIKILNELS